MYGFTIIPAGFFDEYEFFANVPENAAQIDIQKTRIFPQETPASILNRIIDVIDLLEEDNPRLLRDLQDTLDLSKTLLTRGVYRRTAPIIERPTLDLPSHTPFPLPSHTCTFQIRQFYNHTENVIYADDSTQLDSILRVNDPQLLQTLDNIDDALIDIRENLRERGQLAPVLANALGQIERIDIPRVLPIFSDLQLQRRQTGGIFEYNATGENWAFSCQLPLQYAEFNSFASEEVAQRIRNTRIVQLFSAGEGETDLAAFFQDHLVSDKFGIGDFRLTLLRKAHHSPTAICWGGLEITLPTGGAISEGLAGSEFPTFPLQPTDEVRRSLAEFGITSEFADAFTQDVGLTILDRLTRIFADRPLGQEHFGIAPIAYWHVNAQSCDIFGKVRIEYLTPRNLTRFFIRNITLDEIDRRNFTNEKQAEENATFILNAVLDTILPPAQKVTVKPGLSPHAMIGISQDHGTWNWNGGFDFWLKQGERISVPHSDPERVLNIRAAEQPTAWQCKLFFNANTYVYSKRYVWKLGLTFDGTYAARNIGKDSTIGLHFGTVW